MWHNRFARIVAACTLILIAAGGMVTSTGSGLSVPDWPTTYGWNMFTFPLSRWVGGIRYEHFHRLVASTVGFLTIILAIWTARVETRRWVRWLGWACLGAVIVQGLLGGITVLLKLPPAVSIGHAGLAQIFFCLTLTLAIVTSPGWRAASAPVDDSTLRVMAALTTGLIYTQIILGATMRHTNAGMAIPTFPLAFGHLIPPFWNPGIAIHFAHRVGAMAVSIVVLATVAHVFYHHLKRLELVRPAFFLVACVCLQVALGAFVVLSGLQPIINTAHVVNGALVLGASVVLTLRTFRGNLGDVREPAIPRADSHGRYAIGAQRVRGPGRLRASVASASLAEALAEAGGAKPPGLTKEASS
jgi:cytochrome c oxidase assembly protein subunit 15